MSTFSMSRGYAQGGNGSRPGIRRGLFRRLTDQVYEAIILDLVRDEMFSFKVLLRKSVSGKMSRGIAKQEQNMKKRCWVLDPY